MVRLRYFTLPTLLTALLILPPGPAGPDWSRLAAQEAPADPADDETGAEAEGPETPGPDAAMESGSGATAADEPVRSALQEWRDTLLYGLNSQIEELLPTLTENREADVLPEVVALFETTNDAEVLAAAAAYLTALESPDGWERSEEIISRETQRDERLLVALMNYLRETEASLSEETIDTLRRTAIDGALSPATAAVRLMASSGVSAEILIEIYEDTFVSDEVRGTILIELGERRDAEVFDFVSDIIREDEEATSTLQRYAIDTLGKLGDPRALPTILFQMGSDDAFTRAYAVSALASFETPEADRAVVTALRDEFWRVRVAALQTIRERALSEALPAVMYVVRRDPERRVRLEAIETLAVLDSSDGWALLHERFRSTRTGIEERGAIAQAMIEHDLGASMETLMEVMQQEWETENSRVLDTIGRLVSQADDPRIEPIAARLLDHPNYILQIYGLRAMGRNRLTGLREIAENREGEGNHRAVRQAAIRALEQLGP
jgi:HEAT repeat protein